MKNTWKVLLVILSFCFITNISMINPKAYECTSDLVEKYLDGKYVFTDADKASIKNCTCQLGLPYAISDCQKMKSAMGSSSDGTSVGHKYYVYSTPKKNDEVYKRGMSDIVYIVKSVLSLFIGITLILLGFGFLWNISQMGLHSSNPQMRQQCLEKIGEIFATALFIGLIPLIVEFITQIMQSF